MAKVLINYGRKKNDFTTVFVVWKRHAHLCFEFSADYLIETEVFLLHFVAHWSDAKIPSFLLQRVAMHFPIFQSQTQLEKWKNALELTVVKTMVSSHRQVKFSK